MEEKLKKSGHLRAPRTKAPQKNPEPIVLPKEIRNDDDDNTKTENMDEIRESHLDAEGVLVGNENDSDFELVEPNELPPEMTRRSTRGRKSSSKKVSQSQSK
jgi:hypothetical protein